MSRTRSEARPATWCASPFTITILSCKTLWISPTRSKVSFGSTSTIPGTATSSFRTSCTVAGRAPEPPPLPPPSSSSSSILSRSSRILTGLNSSMTEESSESEVSESEFSGDESGLTKKKKKNPSRFSKPTIQGISYNVLTSSWDHHLHLRLITPLQLLPHSLHPYRLPPPS